MRIGGNQITNFDQPFFTGFPEVVTKREMNHLFL